MKAAITNAEASANIMAWWFATSDELPHGDGCKVVSPDGQAASIDPFDALQYATGPILYRGRLAGTIAAEGDEYTCDWTALARRDATETLRAFARKQAMSVLHLWDAPAVVREYLETGDESKREAAGAAALAAAWAARVATWVAAGEAARVATWAAAGAARGAAWEACSLATGSAAGAAAWEAANNAPWAETRAAAMAAARKLFADMIAALFGGQDDA